MKELINQISAQLRCSYPEDEAKGLAWWIVEEETGLSRSQILCGCKDTTFSPHMQEVVDRLLHFEPIQYIYGHTLWCGLDLKVTPATLIPRPETAELVERVESGKWKEENLSLLDIGTGSGCIALAIKKAHPEWKVTGIDISAEAIEVAKENARRNKMEVEFVQKDIFSGFLAAEGHDSFGFNGKNYDIVVSNPPYIRESEKVSMKSNVLDYEPATALFVKDDDPLKFYRRIAELKLGKYLYFEINEAFGEEMRKMMDELGYTDIQITEDIYGKSRIIEGRVA